MQKICKNCSLEFDITDEDFDFYNKIEVPTPTLCPKCREMRRMAWCNEGMLYSRKCEFCKKDIIAQLAENNPRSVYCIDCWWSDKFDALNYGREIDFSRSVFDQIHELELSVPHACVSTDLSNINSEYTHHAGQEKNCYLTFHTTFAEDCYYGYGVKKAKNCIDVHNCFESELCYECVDVNNCYNLNFSQDCFTCSDSSFLRDCIGCKRCFLCTGLRNKEFCFLNKQYSKEEFEKIIKDLNTGSHDNIQKYLNEYRDLQLKHSFKNLKSNMTENSLGNYLYKSKDCQFCFDCRDMESCKYCSQMQLGVKNCYDIYQYGVNSELCYEGAMIGTNAYNIRFCYLCLWQVSDLTYCIDCYNSSECFGCFGLKKNKFCIFNKQYSEAEYFELKRKIIEKMKNPPDPLSNKGGIEWGEFFPIKYSQSAYNETTAQMWFPLTREQALGKGYTWQDHLPGTYYKETLIELPDDIKNTDESIIKEVLKCQNCSKNYKIIKQEFDFYKKQNLPIPRNCFECRRIARMKLRDPRYFCERACGKCGQNMITAYVPDKPELVYCEKCYLESVY